MIGHLDQLFGQKRGRFVGQTQGRRMADACQLPTNRSIDARMRVPVQIGPYRSIGIQIRLAVLIA